MPRKQGKAVPESNGPVPHHDELGSDQPTMVDLYRMLIEQFDRSDKQFDELMETPRERNQPLTSLEHEAW